MVSAAREFLAFTLGGAEYGIDIEKVQELCRYDAVSDIAHAPPFIKRVFDLRGVIVPIIDMRIKFNLGDPTCEKFTAVIILNIAANIMAVAVAVDSVSDVVALTAEQINPAPETCFALDTSYMIGLGTLDQRVLILVDIDQLISASDIGLIEKLVA
jgi:purine-binding chemotaxis protein CheW